MSAEFFIDVKPNARRVHALFGISPTPLGRILLAGDGERLTGLWFEGQKYFAASAGEPMTEKSDLPLFRLAGSWLDEYFHGQNPAIADLPLAPQGQRVSPRGLGYSP